jgi:hypothetical protein
VLAAVVPAREADEVWVAMGSDFDGSATDAEDDAGAEGCEVLAAVPIEIGGDAGEHFVGGGAAAADDDELGLVPGFVEADGEAPRGWPSSSMIFVQCQPYSAMSAKTFFSPTSVSMR